MTQFGSWGASLLGFLAAQTAAIGLLWRVDYGR